MKTAPPLKHVGLMVFLVVAYTLVVRGIFGWLYSFQGRLQTSGFRFLSIETAADFIAPYAIAVACVVGLLRQQIWAWWLTLAVMVYELASFAPHLPRYFGGDLWGALGLFKLAWQVAMITILLLARPKSDPATKQE